MKDHLNYVWKKTLIVAFFRIKKKEKKNKTAYICQNNET